MTRTRVTAFSEYTAMMTVMQAVLDEGHWARPGRTAKYPYCVVTEVDGARFLKSKGFKRSVAQAVEVMDIEELEGENANN